MDQVFLIIVASLSYSETPHSVGLLCTSGQPDAEAPTWQYIIITRDSHLHPGGIRTHNPSEQPQTHALDRSATGTGVYIMLLTKMKWNIINVHDNRVGWGCLVGIVVRLRARWCWVRIPMWKEFIFTPEPRNCLWGPPRPLFNGYKNKMAVVWELTTLIKLAKILRITSAGASVYLYVSVARTGPTSPFYLAKMPHKRDVRFEVLSNTLYVMNCFQDSSTSSWNGNIYTAGLFFARI